MNDKGSKLDMDLIQMVQNARMQNDSQAKPSEVSAVYWIEAKAPAGAPTPNAGAWVIQTTLAEVDGQWAKVKAATEAGKLGYKSKVSTSPGKNQGLADMRLIHVRLADSADTANVERVRAALLELGFAEDKMDFEPDKAS